MSAAKSSGAEWVNGKERPQDMLQWYLDDPLEANASLERMAAFQLVASFGAVDGTTNHIVNCLFDLCGEMGRLHRGVEGRDRGSAQGGEREGEEDQHESTIEAG